MKQAVMTVVGLELQEGIGSSGSDDEVGDGNGGNQGRRTVLHSYQIAAQLMGGQKSMAEVQVLHLVILR
jgi:hypothetical protein